MPTYDYQCRACGSVTEVIHSMLEDGPSACERCGGELRRVLYPTGIIFKGSGFYRTDSRADATRSSGSPATSGSDGAKPSDTPTGSAEKKPAASDGGAKPAETSTP